MPEEEAAKLWRCPRCGRRYDSPVRIKGISCGNNAEHPSGKTEAMVPGP